MLGGALQKSAETFYQRVAWSLPFKTDGRILKANLSKTRKKSNSSDPKIICVYIFFCT